MSLLFLVLSLYLSFHLVFGNTTSYCNSPLEFCQIPSHCIYEYIDYNNTAKSCEYNTTNEGSCCLKPNYQSHNITFFRLYRRKSANSTLQQFILLSPLNVEIYLQPSLKSVPYREDFHPFSLRGSNISDSIFGNLCRPTPSCDPYSRHRTPDGSCNNLAVSLYGRSFTPNRRILPSRYSDGYSKPPLSIRRVSLPSPRLISSRLTNNADSPSSQYSNLLMIFGQFIDHDIAHSPVFKGQQGEIINCCESSNYKTECLPIRVALNDTQFGGPGCMNFVRSITIPALDCKPGPIEQMNQLTHWLDASNIYGSSQAEEDALRSFHNGQMKMRSEFRRGKNLLPHNPHNDECVNSNNCFLAGDSRVNEQPTLTVMHTLWVREHNRISEALKAFNPSWEEEFLFKEVRRIVNAEWQHIIYHEWLPIILGADTMKNLELETLDFGYSDDYRFDLDPRISNEFAAAAFRFGHTLVPGIIKTFTTLGRRLSETHDLKDFFNIPNLLAIPGFVDEIIEGMIAQPVEEFDNNIAEDLTEHLFKANNNTMDLIAVNIQRGRDHGLPPYIEYLRVCKIGDVSSFDELSQFMSKEKVETLKEVYLNVQDIDLYIGMILENAFQNAYIGRTFLCLIADQFSRLKKGDRFFYDLGSQSGSFNPFQLEEIRKVTMSRLLCDNSDSIFEIQLSAFRLQGSTNPKVKCDDTNGIPKMNLKMWKDPEM